MKKIFILVLLLFSLINLIGITYAVEEPVDYPIQFIENKRWDIETGLYVTDDNYRSSNRMQIRENEITLNNANYHHILFWSASTYLGYYNSSPNYEGSKYLGDTTLEIVIPANATWFALTAYELAPNDIPISDLSDEILNFWFEDTTNTLGTTLQASQLVSNSGNPFINTTGYTAINSVISISNNYLVNTGNGTLNTPRHTIPVTINYLNGLKVYVYSTSRVTNAIASSLNVSLIATGMTTVTNTTQSNPIQNTWYNLSSILTATSGGSGAFIIRLSHIYFTSADSNNQVMETSKVYVFNISTLISNKQYSPLFNTTFNHMTDNNIKTQLDSWVTSGLSTIIYAGRIEIYAGVFAEPTIEEIEWMIANNAYNIDAVRVINGFGFVNMQTYYQQYRTNVLDGWDDGISALLFYSMEATYDREPIVVDDRPVIDKVDDWLDGFGLGTFMKVLISLVWMIATSVILALVGAKGAILLINMLLWFVVFSIFGWFPLGLIITVSIILLALTYILIKGSGGNSE